MFIKFKNYIIRGINYRPTYYILTFFILLFITMMLSSIYAAENNFLNAFTVSIAIVFFVNLFCLMFKWGFLRASIERYKINKEQSKQNREKIQLKKMSPREQSVYKEVIKRREQKQKELQIKKSKTPKSNLGWYLVFWISGICFISSIPFVF